jgi:hypothetical protein
VIAGLAIGVAFEFFSIVLRTQELVFEGSELGFEAVLKLMFE